MAKDIKNTKDMMLFNLIAMLNEAYHGCDDEFIIDTVKAVNVALLSSLADARGLGPDDIDEVRTLARVQADQVLWSLMDFVNYMEENHA